MFIRNLFVIIAALFVSSAFAASPSCNAVGPRAVIVQNPPHAIYAYGVSSNTTAVNAAIWSDANGQDDLRWYSAVNQGGGTWKVNVDFTSLKSSGNVSVHVYMNSADQANVFCGSAEFAYKTSAVPPSCTGAGPASATIDIPSQTIFAYGVRYASRVNFAVWSEQNGQDDLRWYSASPQDDGNWRGGVDFANLKNKGRIFVHVYMSAPSAENVFCGFADFTFTEKVIVPPSCDGAGPLDGLVHTPAQTLFAFSVKNADSVAFAVWSEANGQDDLRWYTGNPQINGQWTVNVDFASLKNKGRIFAHVYLIAGPTTVFCGAADFTYEDLLPTCAGFGPLGPETDGTQLYTVYANGVKDALSVNFAVWSEANGQDDLFWYPAKNFGGGLWQADLDFKRLKSLGEISVHAYMNGASVQNVFCGNAHFTYVKRPPSCTGIGPNEVSVAADARYQTIYAFGVTGAQAVIFPVWSDENGQDDLRWYQASNSGVGTWSAIIDLPSHPGGEKVHFHSYLQGELETIPCGGSFFYRRGGDGWYFDVATDEFVMSRRDAVNPVKGKGFWLGNKRIKVYRNLQGSMWVPNIFPSYTLDPLSVVHATQSASTLGSGVVYVHDGTTYWSNNLFQSGNPYQSGITASETRVGLGYVTTRLTQNNLALAVTTFVPSYDLNDPVIVEIVEVTNVGTTAKHLRLSSYDDLYDAASIRFDQTKNALLRGPGGQQSGTVTDAQRLFLTSTEPIAAYDGELSSWSGAVPGGALSNSTGGGNTIFAGQVIIDLQPKETKRFAFVLGTSRSESEQSQLIENYRKLATVDAALASTIAFYRQKTAALPIPPAATAQLRIQLKLLGFLTLAQPLWWDQFTGKFALNQMGNYLDDVTARDTAQIALALTLLDPALSKQALTEYFQSQQWSNGQINSGFNSLAEHGPDAPLGADVWGSDNIAWMALASCEYLAKTGDTAWLNTVIPYRDSAAAERIYEHLQKALLRDYTANLLPNGLLDNQGGDGINHSSGSRLKHGSSVYSSALLRHATERCLPFLTAGDSAFFAGKMAALAQAIDERAYDGAARRYGRWITTDGVKIGTASDNRIFPDMAVIGLGKAFDPARVSPTLLASYQANTGYGNLAYTPSYSSADDSLGLYTVPNWLFDQKVRGRVCALVSVALNRQGEKTKAWDNLVKCMPDRRKTEYSSPLNFNEFYDPRGDVFSNFGAFRISDASYPNSVDDAMVLWAFSELTK